MYGLINIFHMQVVTCICMEHKYVNTDTCCGVLMCMCTCMWYTTAIGCHDVFCFVIHSKERVGWETQQRYTINVVHTLHSSALSLCCRKFFSDADLNSISASNLAIFWPFFPWKLMHKWFYMWLHKKKVFGHILFCIPFLCTEMLRKSYVRVLCTYM